MSFFSTSTISLCSRESAQNDRLRKCRAPRAPVQDLLSVAAPVQVTSYPYYLANKPVQGKEQLDVTDKYSGQVAYRVAIASPEEISG